MARKILLSLGPSSATLTCREESRFSRIVVPWTKTSPLSPDCSWSTSGDSQRLGSDLETWASSQPQVANLAGASLDVSPGLAYSHVGVIAIKGVKRTNQTLTAVAQGWLWQQLQLDPAEHELRYSPTKDGERLLVTAVPCSVLVQLKDFAKLHRLQLVSCLPAAVRGLQARLEDVRGQSRPATGTFVWTELEASGRRGARVQLFHVALGQVLHSWRGWVPRVDDDEDDVALLGAVRRFQAARAEDEAGSTWRCTWPTGSNAGAAHATS